LVPGNWEKHRQQKRKITRKTVGGGSTSLCGGDRGDLKHWFEKSERDLRKRKEGREEKQKFTRFLRRGPRTEIEEGKNG